MDISPCSLKSGSTHPPTQQVPTDRIFNIGWSVGARSPGKKVAVQLRGGRKREVAEGQALDTGHLALKPAPTMGSAPKGAPTAPFLCVTGHLTGTLQQTQKVGAVTISPVL